MDRQEHIHIISTGERIHAAYTAAFRNLLTITQTCVFANSRIYEIPKDPDTEKARATVRNTVSLTKETSASYASSGTSSAHFPTKVRILSSVYDESVTLLRAMERK